MKLQNRAYGFGAIGIVIIVCVLGIVGFVSWKLLMNNASKSAVATDTQSSAASTTPTPAVQASAPPKLPVGYSKYDNSSFHFSFGYPDKYGSFTEAAAGSGGTTVEHYFTSQNPTAHANSGLLGPISIFVYKAGEFEISSRKYGPMIKLTDGKWIVTSLNPADESNIKVGDTYTKFADAATGPQIRGVGNVFGFDSGDEGCTTRRYAFLSQGRLVQIGLPEYCDASGYSGGESPTPEQIGEHAVLLKSVLDSIWITQ